MLGGPIIAGATLSRFFAFHVFVIPGRLLLFVFCMCGWCSSLASMNGRCPAGSFTARLTRGVQQLTHEDGIPFVPGAFWKDLVFSGAILAARSLSALSSSDLTAPAANPIRRSSKPFPSPTSSFLWIYTVLSYLPPEMETPFMLIAPDRWHRGFCSRCRSLPRGREELASPPGCRARRSPPLRSAGRTHASWHLHSVEPAYERVEQRPDPSARLYTTARRSTRRAQSSSRPSNAATATPSAAWRRAWPGA